MNRTWHVIGIDPAPSKDAAICINGTVRADRVPPQDLRAFIKKEIRGHKDVLISWDSPLSFGNEFGYYNRPVDKAVKQFLKEHTDKGRLAPGAVSVAPFAGCPHWVVSCAVLGAPFGNAPRGLKLAHDQNALEQGGAWLVEVHPAVALGVWWIDSGAKGAMPRYKPGKSGSLSVGRERAKVHLAELVKGLDPFQKIPERAAADDDTFDAWVAWKMGRDWLKNKATMVGDGASGAYILPNATKAAIGLHDELKEKLEAARNELRTGTRPSRSSSSQARKTEPSAPAESA